MSEPHAYSLIESIVAAGNAYEQGDTGARESLLALSHALIARLEMPSEFMQRSFWAEPAKSAICRIAVDLNIFQYLEDAGKAGLDFEELAAMTGSQLGLIERLMRHLVSTKVLTITDGKLHCTTLSNGLSEEKYRDSIVWVDDISRPLFNQLPEYLRSTSYREPLSATDGPFQHHFKTTRSFYDWKDATPQYEKLHKSLMSSFRAGKPDWFMPGYYPVAERLVNGFDEDNGEALLVDIGGNRGDELRRFVEHHSEHPGKLVLEDLDAVLSAVDTEKTLPFEICAHDFFKPQPVKGARAYYLHSILHNWNDEDSLRILENIKPALKPGYSRVLINEIAISDENPSLSGSTLDILMMTNCGSLERTEGHWKSLLEKAGLKVRYIYSHPEAAESIIEAELPAQGVATGSAVVIG
ncbi:putative hydroxyindole O-methyltransferase [Truncatella angustata]|uniref:Hydroxyindole O-methyltransferase n=1 Tax=Truncatella angustata TaxID=152316 RepID=A0A9P8U9H0_9PEZI|nr:putative hydroxyindole O-methyltransferase [Truncatella angustata]KAH6646294.1 putative hydroxyindole O-methyltransferase [Truncatella angustata]KAH8201124.1 hypothetical protein TruAng_004674 [Truncatella angustata]